MTSLKKNAGMGWAFGAVGKGPFQSAWVQVLALFLFPDFC